MTPLPPPVGQDRMGYYHLLTAAADAAAHHGDLVQAVIVRAAAQDVADDLAAELVRNLP